VKQETLNREVEKPPPFQAWGDVTFSNSLALIVFMPAVLLLFCITLKKVVSLPMQGEQSIARVIESDPQPAREIVS
jgi:hypothetical protein